jgi:hypothetical protein
MAQTFLEAGEQRALVTGLDIDHPGRAKPGLGQRWGEEILAGDALEYLTMRPRRNAGGEQSRRRAVDRAVSPTPDLVQRAEREAAARQRSVDHRHTEGQRSPPASRVALKAFDAATQIGEDGVGIGLRRHACSLEKGHMFLICSCRGDESTSRERCLQFGVRPTGSDASGDLGIAEPGPQAANGSAAPG